jgi:hypothetical protein
MSDETEIRAIADAQDSALRATDQVLKEVRAERARQFAEWGWHRPDGWDGDKVGHAHDDGHVPGDWTRFVVRHLGRAEQAIEGDEPGRWRDQMLRVAALAVAAVESHDRKRP